MFILKINVISINDSVLYDYLNLYLLYAELGIYIRSHTENILSIISCAR